MALIVSAGKGLLETPPTLPRLDTIPFDSAFQYMATLHATDDGTPHRVYAKGSIEALLTR